MYTERALLILQSYYYAKCYHQENCKNLVTVAYALIGEAFASGNEAEAKSISTLLLPITR